MAPHMAHSVLGCILKALCYVKDTSLGEKPFAQGGNWKKGVARALISGNNSGTEMDYCFIIFWSKKKRTRPFPTCRL